MVAGFNSSCCECAFFSGSMSCSSTHLFFYFKDLVRCSQLSWFFLCAPQVSPAVGPFLYFLLKPSLSCNLSLTSPAFHQQKRALVIIFFFFSIYADIKLRAISDYDYDWQTYVLRAKLGALFSRPPTISTGACGVGLSCVGARRAS